MLRVSVVVPLYNKEKHIKAAIDSILAQTVQDFEIIVVDDGSTDSSADVVRLFKDERIRFIQQPNAGVSAARNKGINEAETDLIAFLDADDAWNPMFLETVLSLYEKYPQSGVCCTAYRFIDVGGNIKVPKLLGIPTGKWEGIIPNYFLSILGWPPVWVSAVLVPKRVLFDVGLFPIGEELGEDIDLWLRIALKYPIAFSSMICATYFRGATNRASRSGAICPDRVIKKTALTALHDGIVKDDSAEYLNEFIYKNDLEVATLMLWAGKKRGVGKLLKNCHTKRFSKKKLWLYFCLVMPHCFVMFIYKLKDPAIKQQCKKSRGVL